MKTLMAKEIDSKTADLKIGDNEIARKWYIIDASGMALGRVASAAASILRGKNKPIFTPHTDTGDYVIIINSDQVVLTGKKLETKVRYRYSGHIGGLKAKSFKDIMANNSDDAVYTAVKGMLPKNALGRKMFKKLRVYKNAEHKHEAQKPELISIGKR